MDNLNQKRRNLDGYCLDAVSFASDLVKKLKQCFQEKLDGFIYTFIDQIKIQQRNFTILLKEKYFDKLFLQLQENIKYKIDSLQSLQNQINDLNAVIIVQTIIKPNLDQLLHPQEIKQINNQQQSNNNKKQINNNQLVLQEDQDEDDQVYNLFDQKVFGQHKALNNPDEWLRHLIYTCQECEQVFVGMLMYRSHIKAIHDVRHTYKCQYCDKLFMINREMATHFFKEHSRVIQDKSKRAFGNTLFTCPYTNIEFTCQNNLAKHILRTLQYHAQQPDNLFQPNQNSIYEEQPYQEENAQSSKLM